MVELGNMQFRYFSDIGEVPEGSFITCGVCGDKMEEKRNCLGPRNYLESIGGHKHHHDQFFCPNRDSKWHKQVVALREQIQLTPSAKIAKMLEEEAAEILFTREETKVGYA